MIFRKANLALFTALLLSQTILCSAKAIGQTVSELKAPNIKEAVFSSDSQFLVSLSDEGSLFATSTDGRNEEYRLEDSVRASSIGACFKTRVYFTDGEDVKTWDFKTGVISNLQFRGREFKATTHDIGFVDRRTTISIGEMFFSDGKSLGILDCEAMEFKPLLEWRAIEEVYWHAYYSTRPNGRRVVQKVFASGLPTAFFRSESHVVLSFGKSCQFVVALGEPATFHGDRVQLAKASLLGTLDGKVLVDEGDLVPAIRSISEVQSATKSAPPSRFGVYSTAYADNSSRFYMLSDDVIVDVICPSTVNINGKQLRQYVRATQISDGKELFILTEKHFKASQISQLRVSPNGRLACFVKNPKVSKSSTVVLWDASSLKTKAERE